MGALEEAVREWRRRRGWTEDYFDEDEEDEDESDMDISSTDGEDVDGLDEEDENENLGLRGRFGGGLVGR